MFFEGRKYRVFECEDVKHVGLLCWFESENIVNIMLFGLQGGKAIVNSVFLGVKT